MIKCFDFSSSDHRNTPTSLSQERPAICFCLLNRGGVLRVLAQTVLTVWDVPYVRTVILRLWWKRFFKTFFQNFFFNTFFKKIFIKTFLSTLTTLWRSIDVFLWWTFFDSFDDPLTSPRDGPSLTPRATHWCFHMMDLFWLLWRPIDVSTWWTFFDFSVSSHILIEFVSFDCICWTRTFLISYLMEGWLWWPLRLYFILLRLASATFLCYWLTEATFLRFFITRFPCVLGLGLCLLSHAHWFCWILFRLDLSSWTRTFLTPYLVVGVAFFLFVILVTWTIWRSAFMQLHVPKRVVEDRPSEHPSHDLLLV